LITGANGAGKEKIAEIIRANSAVKDAPFVTVNCGALPAELIEAELFGAEEGAYTGANRTREGKFEAADGGTLFLDEIGNLSASGQMKLLRVLETGRFERLGSNQEQTVSVRVISATNADLAAMIREGSFREDLYYRLNTIEIRIPRLADRPDDIAPLAAHFLAGDRRLSKAAARALRAHDWPGNVRELKNTLERAALLATRAEIGAADLGLPGRGRPAAAAAPLEPEAIERALARAGGVVAAAADDLGVSRQALYRRMQKLGIEKA
jgi:DNA-binding NtrC family response regulator